MPHTPRKETVREMFNDISHRYDFLNHFLSMGIDRRWRSRLVSILSAYHPDRVLDVACGTCDLALAVASLKPQQIHGIDISGKMLEIGRQKIARAGLEKIILLKQADAEKIPFSDNSFDAVTVAFGVRNFEDLRKGLAEMSRALRPSGVMLILEFSHPETFPMKQLYGFYSRYFIPLAGRLISGNRHAYSYLPESVAAFPSGNRFLEVLTQVGLRNTRQIRLSGGIATVYLAEK